MTRSTLRLGLFLVCLFIGAAPGHADSDFDLDQGRLPPRFYGQWATPSCSAPYTVLTIYDHLVMEASEATNVIYRMSDIAMIDDLILARSGSLNMFLSNARDDRITVGQLFDENIKDNIPIKTQLGPNEKFYYRCEKIEQDWPSLTPAAIEIAPHIDDLEKECNGASIESCENAAFKLMDTDHDGLLNIAELERGYTLMIYYAGSIGCDFPDKFNDDVQKNKIAFAEDSVEILDRNKDYKLSLEEIIDGWDRIRLEPTIQNLLAYGQNLPLMLNTIPNKPE